MAQFVDGTFMEVRVAFSGLDRQPKLSGLRRGDPSPLPPYPPLATYLPPANDAAPCSHRVRPVPTPATRLPPRQLSRHVGERGATVPTVGVGRSRIDARL